MALDNLKPALKSTHKTKRVGRGQGSGMGKTATRGGKGQTARTGYTQKRGFEGGQQPLQRRLPKVGFTSKVVKPYIINIEKHKEILSLETITLETLHQVHKFSQAILNVKLVGNSALSLSDKIKDERVITTGKNK